MYGQVFCEKIIQDNIQPYEYWASQFIHQGPGAWGYPKNYQGQCCDWMKVGGIVKVVSVNGFWEIAE